MDAAAALAFPHFGFGGWKEHYTGYFPVWRLSYSLPLWAKGVERETGWGLQAMFRLPPDFEIPFFDPEYVRALFEAVVKQAIEEQGWRPMLEAVRKCPVTRILSRGTQMPGKISSASGITHAPKRFRRFHWKS